jgi:type I restriction enzyme, S subunit
MSAEVPEGWELAEVGDIAKVIRGASPRPKGDPRYYGGKIPRLMVADVTRDGKFVNPRIDFLTDEGAKKSRPMSAGSLFMVCSGTVGVPGILAVDACIHDGFLGFEEIDERIDKDYLFYNFQRLQVKLDESATHGGVFTNLTTSIVREFQIAIPPLDEQKKIAEIFGSVDEAIAATEAVIEQTKYVKQGLLTDLLAKGIGHTRFKQTEIGKIPECWEVTKLGELSTLVTSGSRGWAKYYSDKGAKFLRITNLTRSRLRMDLKKMKFVELPEKAVEGKRTQVHQGDILISITADLGTIGLVDDQDLGEAYINQHIALVRPDADNVESGYVAYALSSSVMQNRFLMLNDPGAKAALNLPAIRKIDVPIPPRKEQERICKILTDIDFQISQEESNLNQLRRVKKGLMADLLTGRKRVSV